ncbi:MAG TPA: glycosyltransferase [Gemmatimonadaceae bacterium]|jgi:glycosyltransferase involved in cell wall biosynthesis
MRVLFLTHSFPRYDGDVAGSFLLRLAVALEHEGVSVRALAPAAPDLADHASIEGIEVDRFRYAPRALETLAYSGDMPEQVARSMGARAALLGMFAGELRAVIRATRATRPDVVHAHWWFPSGIVATLARRFTGVPVVTTMHGTDVRIARRAPAARPILARVMRRSAAVTAVSEWLADEAHELTGAARPIVAPMPVAIHLFSPGQGGLARERLLFVGRLTQQKGLDLLLRALALGSSSIGLDVVGDGPERAALMDLAETLGIAPRVRWLGTQPPEALPTLYRSAVALVVASIEEGLGLVAVEALLCETPVVAFASGGLTDVVVHGVTGLLVEHRDPRALASAIGALLDLPDRGASLGHAGRTRVLSQFSPEVVARRYHDIYESARATAGR